MYVTKRNSPGAVNNRTRVYCVHDEHHSKIGSIKVPSRLRPVVKDLITVEFSMEASLRLRTDRRRAATGHMLFRSDVFSDDLHVVEI